MTGMIECCVGWYKRSGEREERVKVAGKSKEKKKAKFHTCDAGG